MKSTEADSLVKPDAREVIARYFDDTLGRTDWFSPDDYADQFLQALERAGFVIEMAPLDNPELKREIFRLGESFASSLRPGKWIAGSNYHTAVMFDPGNRFHGWLFRQHPDGAWVPLRQMEKIPNPPNPPSPSHREKEPHSPESKA